MLHASDEKKCEYEICTEPATVCAALTQFDGVLLAHRYLCPEHARTLFAVNVDREARLQAALNRVKAASSANERTAAFEALEDRMEEGD